MSEDPNEASKFIKASNFSAADSYNLSRQRTYACCFSLENSDYIWKEYGNVGNKGKVCLVFEFGKLRSMLNETLQNSAMKYQSVHSNQIFFINYGMIKYVDWGEYQANISYLPNPIIYTYLKDNKYQPEQELRISLSTFGIGKFDVGGNEMIFPEYLEFDFDYQKAIENGTIQNILEKK